MIHQAKQQVTVISLNMFGVPFHPKKILRTLFRNHVLKRFHLLAFELMKEQADILLLQEVHTYHSFFYLRRLLKQYPFALYEQALYGPRGGLVIFSKIPIEKAQYTNFRKRGSFWNKSISGKLMRNGMLLAKIKGTALWLLNTHLTQNSDHDWSRSNRFIPFLTSQLAQCTETIDLLQQAGQAVIAGGDFNMPKGSEYYKTFRDTTGLKDAFAHGTSPTYHQIFLPDKATVGRIDYLYYSQASFLQLSEHEHILTKPMKMPDGTELYLTDHIGLKGVFTLHD